MAKNSFLRKTASVLVLIIFIITIFSDASFSSLSLSNGETALDDNSELKIVLESNLVIDEAPITTNFESNDTVFGEGIHLTPSDLRRDYYSVAQGMDGRLHCIWKQQHTQHGLSLFYSYSNDSIGNNWSISDLLFRFEEDVITPKLVVDNNDNLHIAMIIKRDKYSRVYYLNYSTTTSTRTLVPVFTTNSSKFSSLKIGISHNDTVNIAWIAKKGTSAPFTWESMIQLQRRNITTNEWLPEPINLYKESNPNILDISTDYNSLHVCWTNSSDFSNTQTISHIFFNESTKLWSTYESLTLSSEYIKVLTISIASDEGLHVLWAEGTSYSALYYLKWFTNSTTTSPTIRLNNVDGNNFHAYIIENESSGDLHLVFEDAKGFLTSIYHRKMFISNGSWTPIVQLSTTAYSNDPIFMKAKASPEIIGYLLYISEGSLVYQYLNTSENWFASGIIYYGTHQTLLQSAVVDSDGVIHMVCLHMIAGKRELLYMRKIVNDTRWTDFESLFVIPHDTNPQIIIDSNDTLYIFGVISDAGTGYDAVHYSYKLKGQNNWSLLKLCYTPIGHVPDKAYYHPYMYERPFYDKPTVIVDENNTIHLFWREFFGDQMLLNYAYKISNSTVFSAREILPSYQTDTQIYHISALFDQNNTLHLVHGEFMDELDVAMIIYRSLSPNKTWSELTLIDAAYDWLFRPKIIQDTTGKLQLFYTTSQVYSNWQELYYSDFELYEKMPEDDYWTFKETFMRATVTAGYFDAILLEDDTFYLVYFSGDFSSPFWYREQNEFLTIRKRTSEGVWENETLLFITEITKATPDIIYNPVEELIYIFEEIEMNVNWFGIQKDTDKDTLGDNDEVTWGTDYLIADTDEDGLSDGYEALISLTNPLINDTDWDGLSDSEEVLIYLSDPLSVDSDRDGVEDGAEVLIYHSNPNMKDSDQDFLDDFQEIFEIGSSPILNDTDSDLMPDYWEYINNLDLNFDDSQFDEDDDGLVNLDEYYAGTDIYNPDTDSDYLTDGDEVHNHTTNPLNADTDFDTLTDWEELMKFGTNPFMADSDGDGFSDRSEIESGTDPNDPRDNLRLRKLRTALMYSIIPIGLLTIFVTVVETNFRIKVKKQKKIEEAELLKEEQTLEV
ncbi:MAG: hypothetical protein E3J70_09105 [Candidatus Heimdallarchaeota archaeon]|nr:MAG: hypothetical protein E3J70_09105 [Candidatus Heimdallarchaeota archaeon]